MPIFFQQDIDSNTKVAIWKIEEEEAYFNVPLQRGINHALKRLQHLAGRYLLQYLFPEFPLELIKVADTRKPYLEDDVFHFSISHCDHYAAAIVSRTKRVGIDIEVPSDKVDRIKHKFLHPYELELLNKLNIKGGSEMSDVDRLSLLWSAKEAIFKWWSYGNVDFSDMIRIQISSFSKSGQLDALFLSSGEQISLKVQYELFPSLSFAWVASDH